VKRRKFITLLGGAAVSWPLAARAQQPDRMRRIGVLHNPAADDPDSQARVAAFAQGLQELGWIDGRTVPIVFVVVADPVGAGFVENLARPGGNATGFMAFEFSISGKWLELLKQVAPAVTRVAVLRDPTTTSGIGQFGVIQAMAPSLRVEITQVNARDPAEMDRAVAAFAGAPNGGMIVTSSGLALVHRNLIVELAARHRLPAVYFERRFVADGGLISYDPDQIDQFRRAARYVDRILKGEKPADLPVQAPNKYDLVINLKTAKALSIEVPPTLLARAGTNAT
jgi:putative ABC transport system substrate-binding protein